MKGVLEMLVKLIKLFVQLWVLGVMFHDIKVLKLVDYKELFIEVFCKGISKREEEEDAPVFDDQIRPSVIVFLVFVILCAIGVKELFLDKVFCHFFKGTISSS